MARVSATKARQEFADTLNEVAYRRKRVILRRHGRDVAALIPLPDLDLLQTCEEERKGAARARPPRRARKARQRG